MNVIAPAPPPRPLLATIALGVVILLPVLRIAGHSRGLFYTLCGAVTIIPLLIAVAIYQQRRGRCTNHVSSIILSATAATTPLVTLCLFVVCFVIGHSSNVAQMADHSSFDYWRLWTGAWPILLLGNHLCVMVALIALAMPPYHRRYIASWALPIAALIAALAAAQITWAYFPDA